MRFTKNKVSAIILILVSALTLSCKDSTKLDADKYFSNAALKSERETFFTKTINQTILKNLSLTLNDSTESNYREAFWAMELIQFKNDFTDSVIANCFINLSDRSLEFQRAFLEIIYSLYQNQFTAEIKSISESTANPKLFAMCLSYLKNSNNDLKLMLSNYLNKYPDMTEDPIIVMLKIDINMHSFSIPPLLDLFKSDYQNKIVVFSIQRSNRDYPGLVVIKKPDGKFLLDESGEIFNVSQLARAITDLPGYITNGNTPQGIFSIQSIDSSKNIFIGPTPNLQIVLPFEVNPEKYFHNNTSDSLWNMSQYRNLLPDSWENYFPIYESYYAGKAGRNEIIAHGTTINPEYYKNKSYYPFTPSLGCLTTREIWSNKNGRLIESDQIKFMNAFNNAGSGKGFFIVVNIDDQQSVVTLAELKSFIKVAEKN